MTKGKDEHLSCVSVLRIRRPTCDLIKGGVVSDNVQRIRDGPPKKVVLCPFELLEQDWNGSRLRPLDRERPRDVCFQVRI